MKSARIVYWTTTLIIFLLEGVMPAFTSNSELAKQGFSYLGYPDYFRVMLTVFKVAGAILLVLPVVKGRVKEWVYAGFAFDFICAAASLTIVGGLSAAIIFPLVMLLILVASYVAYHKYASAKQSNTYFTKLATH
ncbi:DoxX family protein [Panacibacter sp. DH6]|uniref:DoxX family protein n=1 Tax=Panacibacter microcysteis TaxID=2793269 RepID=A0A931E994_9BACT|nr:DoxX family protein [Panacibacter microcysteis]MBG9376051.1 DoxX family protein [Panacibacter microcysteis]